MIIDTDEPFAEDHWKTIRMSGIDFTVGSRCDRCEFTTVDPDTGKRHPEKEPLRTLSKYRRRDNGISFGVYLIPRGTGTVHSGDEVEVL